MTDITNHSFNIELASRYGIEESIIFGNIYHWCLHNKNNGNNLRKGKDGVERYYTFNSVSALQAEYRYISITKVYRVIEKLEKEGLIITGCFNKRVGDRTRWYAITEKGEQVFVECNQTYTSLLYNNTQFSNCNLQNEMHNLQNERHNLQNEMTLPIINSNINNNYKNHSKTPKNTTSTPFPEPEDYSENENNNKSANADTVKKRKRTFAYSKYTNHHFQIYKELVDKHLITDKPVDYNYALIAKRIKALLTNPYFTEEKILKGITNGQNDSSCLANNYSLEQMLTEANMTRLIEERYIRNNLSNQSPRNTGGIDYHNQDYSIPF